MKSKLIIMKFDAIIMKLISKFVSIIIMKLDAINIIDTTIMKLISFIMKLDSLNFGTNYGLNFLKIFH